MKPTRDTPNEILAVIAIFQPSRPLAISVWQYFALVLWSKFCSVQLMHRFGAASSKKRALFGTATVRRAVLTARKLIRMPFARHREFRFVGNFLIVCKSSEWSIVHITLRPETEVQELGQLVPLHFKK